MHYISTRANAPELNFEQAATCGLADDGGLYVPKHWPTLSHTEIKALQGLTYTELAVEIIERFVDDSLSREELESLVTAAYADFSNPQIAPLRQIRNNVHLLELFHGPTLSFKDYALQFLGQFMNWSLERRNEKLTVVGATSGDTGSAAIRAVAGRPSIELYMLHPFQRVSDMQRRQMTTNQDENIFNYAVDGTFDDCQSIVKTIFNDAEVRSNRSLGAVNSINWGRITAQVVYYFYSALKLGAPDKAVSFAVPTGNFGNVFAGFSALKMGLPIENIAVCSNSNDILTRFFETGVMKKLGVKHTETPSMDIEVSSNFERFLFELFERDGNQVTELMISLSESGEFQVSDEVLQRAREYFSAYRLDDQGTRQAIAQQFTINGDVVDPHTAVALAWADEISRDSQVPLVVVSTAHPAKFVDTIERSVNSSVNVPEQLADLVELPEKYRRISNDPNELKDLMLSG